MATRVNRPVIGSITLYDKYWESGSGHAENHESANLYVNESEEIILEIFDSKRQFIGKTYNEEKRDKYKITVKELIELIKSSGIQVE